MTGSPTPNDHNTHLITRKTLIVGLLVMTFGFGVWWMIHSPSSEAYITFITSVIALIEILD